MSLQNRYSVYHGKTCKSNKSIPHIGVVPRNTDVKQLSDVIFHQVAAVLVFVVLPYILR